MNKTVVEIDLVRYSYVAAILEDNIGPGAVADLNRQIQGFVDQGLSAAGVSRKQTVAVTTGDGAILVFERPEQAHIFAAATHEASRKHNRDKPESSAKRLFRIGAATGDIDIIARPDGASDISGVTIARAVRLEAAARPGQILIDGQTFESLPQALRTVYSGAEVVVGKGDERFLAHRSVMNSEVPAEPLSSPVLSAPEAKGSRRDVLELFEKLNPNALDRLIFLTEMPIDERPPTGLNYRERRDYILRHFDSPSSLPKLESELRFLIGKQEAYARPNP